MTIRPALVRLLWFAGYWVAGVAVLFAVAAGLRFWLAPS